MQYSNKMKDKSVVAVVVTYNPDMNLLQENLEVLKNQVDEIVIVNNSSSNLKFHETNEVTIIDNGKNLGIAKALNIGVEYGIKNNFKYALLLDQDSTPEKDMVSNLVKGFFSPNVAMTVPYIKYLNGFKEGNTESEFEVIKFAITSGSLLHLEKVHEIGHFDEEFFIDSVDFDYCFKIALKKYLVLRVNKALLYQRLGEVKEHRVLFLRFYPTNHSYIRRYYITRNRIYMWRRYFKVDKNFVIKDMLRSFYEAFLIIAFEDDKIRKFKSIKKGIIDFRKGKVGIINE